jgi:hypothetical protein
MLQGEPTKNMPFKTRSKTIAMNGCLMHAAASEASTTLGNQTLCRPAAYNAGIIGTGEIKTLNMLHASLLKHVPQLRFGI